MKSSFLKEDCVHDEPLRHTYMEIPEYLQDRE
jgi:hypothetical protein